MIDIVPRSTWRMPGPLGPAKVRLPCRGLWLHHAAGSFRDDRDLTVHDDVFTDARAVARVGIDRFGRASYSWFTSPASPRGQVLEMQGHWIGAHTAGQNSSSHALCVMGNFQIVEPDGGLLWTIAATSAHGFLQGWWPQPELAGGHRDAPGAATACPGSHLHDAIPDINRLARELAQEDDMPRLFKRADSRTVYHAVGGVLVPISSPRVARLLAGPDWQDKVTTLTDDQFRLFRVSDLADSGGGDRAKIEAAVERAVRDRLIADLKG